MLRKNLLNANDFSIILVHMADDGEYRIVRYNGSSHLHVNHIEREQGLAGHTFWGVFHIHTATERYQRRDPKKPDGYAVPSPVFSSFDTAFEEFFDHNGFVKPLPESGARPDPQQFLDFGDES